MKGRTPLFYVGLVILGLVALVAVLAPLLSPYDPSAVSGDSLESPSAKHLLGTNDIGQDILSQLVSGTRSSILVAVAAASLAMAVALLVGIGAGLLGGMVDTVTMRVIDLLLAIPTLPLLILVAALAGPSRVTVVVIIGLFGWPDIARTLRAQALSLRQRGYVHLARGLGGGPLYVMRRHLFPALGPLIVANFVGRAGVAIFLDAGLAFLGLSDPTAVSWGQVLFRALNYRGLYYSPLWTWWVLPAGLAVTTVVLGFTFVGVGLETRMNPRAERRS